MVKDKTIAVIKIIWIVLCFSFIMLIIIYIKYKGGKSV